MKTAFSLLIILMLGGLLNVAMCQYDYPGAESKTEQKKNRKEPGEQRIFFGGNLGLSFWSDYAYVELSPLVGYKITPRFWAGGGPKYMYLKIIDYRGHYYGIKTFAQFAVLDNINEVLNVGIGSILLYAEDELISTDINIDRTNNVLYQEDRKWHNIPFAGFGLRFPMGERAGLTLYALWGLSEYADVLYNNPELRLSVDF